MRVTLSHIEAAVAYYCGGARTTVNRGNGGKIGSQDGERADVHAMGAEIAFCKAFNLYPDLQVAEWPLADARFSCGMTVDVKHTDRHEGRLLVSTTKEDKRCDAYVLVTGILPHYEIVGGYPQQLVFKPEHLRDLGYGKTYVIERHQLWPIERLVHVYKVRPR